MVVLTYVAVAAAAVAGTIAAPAPGGYGPSLRSPHVVSPDDDRPDFDFGAHNLARRQDYNQNYKTGGSVNFQPNSNGYSVSFSGAGDFVVGKGWRTGTARYAVSASSVLLSALRTDIRPLALVIT